MRDGYNGLRQQHRCIQQASGLHCEIQTNTVYGFLLVDVVFVM